MGKSRKTKPAPEQNTDILEDDPVIEAGAPEGSTGSADVEESVTGQQETAGDASGGNEKAAEDVSPEAGAGPEAAVAESVEEEELPKVRKELADLNDRHLRLHAEFENYRRRMAQDRENLRKQANEDIVSDLLSVIDHLEMAVQHAEGTSADTLLEGVKMTLKEFETILERYGVKAVNATGGQFDPTLHHAMNQVATDEAEEGTVVEEFRKGYMLHEKLIRAALVSVAKAPEDITDPLDGEKGDEAKEDEEPQTDSAVENEKS